MVYGLGMKALILSSFFALAPAAAMAAGPVALGPNGGQYGHWTAAVYGQGHNKVCYAFTTAQATQGQSKPMLTVSERHDTRDEVSVKVGYDYPHDAKVKLTVGDTDLPLYTERDMAFSADGPGAVTAFKVGNAATLSGTAAHDHSVVTNTFSLDGFSAAYDAIVHACP